MKLTRKIYTTRREKIVDFIIGSVGIIVINVATWLISTGIEMLPALFQWNDFTVFQLGISHYTIFQFVTLAQMICQATLYLVTIVLLIYLGLTRKWITFGAIVVIVAFGFTGLCLAIFFVGTACFMYFTNPYPAH